MTKPLLVVESPAKAKTIEKFLKQRYRVMASMGHLRDLPKSQFGVDVEHGFVPKYINIRGKGDLIRDLKDAAKAAEGKVLLATDPDREGEAIAWHLAHLLNLPEETSCRVEFNEITEPAVKNAVKHARPIDIDRVDAQQARRILDRIVGYQLSPLLWRKVRKGLSAGRVQSVAVRLISDRQKEIDGFKPEEYWTISVALKAMEGGKSKGKVFPAELTAVDGKKPELDTESTASTIAAELECAAYQVNQVKRRERRRNPFPPFTTSTLQQDAVRRLGFTSRRTMAVAQQLYEGVSIGKSGSVGLITYMRTDSTRISETAQADARAYIGEHFAVAYLPERPPVYQAKKNAQDAHEAVRPTDILLTPESLSAHLNRDQLRLYKLIWQRFLASQMASAVYDTVTVEIAAGRFGLRSAGSVLKFSGFLEVYGAGKDEADDEKDVNLPDLDEGQQLELEQVEPKQHFTQPPPAYTEASLIKMLEEKGIGRPSTYAPIIETILQRGYVEKIEKKFHPTELGDIVVDLLKEYFSSIVDVEFTAGLEKRLDDIADGDLSRGDVLQEFYTPFKEKLDQADAAIPHVELPVEVTDEKCEICGRNLVVKQGRFGNFLACPGFPECRFTKPITKETGVPCPKCGGMIVERRSKRGKTFYGCNQYPACDFVSWDQPLQETCAICGSFMVRHNFKKGGWSKMCGNEACPTRRDTAPKSEAAEKAPTKKPATKRKPATKTKPATKRKPAAKKTKSSDTSAG